MCVSVIEVAEAAGEHNDLFGETLSNFFDIPVLKTGRLKRSQFSIQLFV